MREVLDKELKGVAMIMDSPIDAVLCAAAAQENNENWGTKIEPYKSKYNSWDEDTNFGSWDELRAAFNKPWEKGVSMVHEMLEELRSCKLPEPKDRRRKRRWSEDRGEIDVDRAIAGELEVYRDIHREWVSGSTSVALLCNLDANAGDTPERVLWRGAAAIACADLLESHGYSCEIWMWCLGYSVYAHPNSNQFHTCCMKQMGDPLDVDSIIKGLSSWFLRYGLFASFAGAKTNEAVSIGGKCTDLGKWRKHMDITDGIKEVQMSVWVTTKEQAIQAATKLLEDLESQQEDY